MTVAGKPSAFVMMPFDETIDWMFEQIYRPVLEGIGYEAIRADTRLNQQAIMKDVVLGIQSASLIVADLTGLNANVMYEVGLAHGVNQPVILLTQDISEVPFDLRSYRLIRYGTDFREMNGTRDDLSKVAAAHLRGEISFSNPMSDFGMRSGTTNSLPIPSYSRPRTIHNQQSERFGLIDIEEQFPKAIEPLVQSMSDIAEFANDFSRNLNARIESINTGPKLKSMPLQQKKSLSTSLARLFNEWSAQTASTAESTQLDWSKVERIVEDLIAHAHPQNEEDQQAMVAFKAVLEQFDAVIESTSQSIESTRESVVEADLGRLSRELGRSAIAAIHAMEVVIGSMARGQALASRSLVVLNDRLGES